MISISSYMLDSKYLLLTYRNLTASGLELDSFKSAVGIFFPIGFRAGLVHIYTFHVSLLLKSLSADSTSVKANGSNAAVLAKTLGSRATNLG